MNQAAGLPPGTDLINGRLVRVLTEHRHGREVEVQRPVALSIEEARKTYADYYDPALGWIRAGRKRETESLIPRPEEALIAGGLDAGQELPDEEN